MANDWFEWNGARCVAYGIRAIELPPITIAQERVTYEKVAGRSGSLAMLEGEDVYEDITLNCRCILDDAGGINRAMAWLRGSGTVIFANRPGGWYEARVANQIEIRRIIAASGMMEFTVNFRAQPYFYLDGAEVIEINSNSAVIVNPGNISSEPRITVYGSGSVGLELGGQLVRLTGLKDGIVLDARLQDALSLDGAQLYNDHMDGEFLRIPPGNSVLHWLPDATAEGGGSVTQIVIEPRWRCL